MRKMLLTIPALLALGLASPAASQEAGDDVQLGSLDEQLFDLVTSMDEDYGVLDVFYHDMSMNGQTEALVILDNCDDTGCEWNLIAHKEGGHTVVGVSWGDDVEFVEAGDAALVWSDGVTWAYSGGWIYPYGSVLDGMKPDTASQDEYDFVVENTDFYDTEDMNLLVYQVDLTSRPGYEKIFIIHGFCCNAGASGHHFLISSNDEEVLAHDISIDEPRIFRSSDEEGATVIRQTPAGYEMIYIE